MQVDLSPTYNNPYIADFVRECNDRFSFDSLSMTYAEWISKNTTMLGRPFSYKGYDFQKQIVNDMSTDMSVIKISQVGLALDLETPIMTSSGWSTMGELIVGDKVYDERGKLCNVTYISPIYRDHPCFEIEFDTGEKIVADENHRWFVKTDRMLHPEKGFYPASGRMPVGLEGYGRESVVTTGLMYKEFKRGERHLFSIPVTEPLKGHKRKLPLDPYFFGVWLGDGHSYSTRITGEIGDMTSIRSGLKNRGFVSKIVGRNRDVLEVKFELASGNNRHRSLYSILSKLGVLQNKHVPVEYLTASKEARMDLLQGLMDTDGSITKRGRCSFYNTNHQLVAAVETLAASLGFKTRTRWRPPAKPSVIAGRPVVAKLPIAEVSFVAYSDTPVFKLPRKRKRLLSMSEGRPTESLSRKIVNITPVSPRPVKCISVDSPSHLYLAGRGMIPTHNTEVQLRKMLAFLKRHRGTKGIFSLPDEAMHERISVSRLKPILESDRVFNTRYDLENKVTRTKEIKQFGKSFLFIVAAVEKAATSIDADIVMNDEVDLSDQAMLALFTSRLQGSKFKIHQRFSTPSFPNFGIDSTYQSSDQHLYMCRCDACGKWNHPEFDYKHIHLPSGLPDVEHFHDFTREMFETLDMSEAYVMCQYCGKRLDLNNSANREWVPTYPTRKYSRGYQVTPFVSDALDIPYILKRLFDYKKDNYLRGWYNTVIGKPYSDETIQVSEEIVREAFTTEAAPPVNSSGDCWIGIDVGQVCHIVVGQGNDADNVIELRICNIRELKTVVGELLKKYDIRAGAIDRHPYEPTASEIMALSEGRIIPVEYRGLKEVNLVFKEAEEPILSHAQVNRTWFLDKAVGRIRNKEMRISGYTHHKEVFIQHLRAMARNEEPEKPAEWKKLNDNDHYFHALAFMVVAPRLAELLRLKSKVDVRSLVLASGVMMQGAQGKLGLVKEPKKKTVDVPLRRL